MPSLLTYHCHHTINALMWMRKLVKLIVLGAFVMSMASAVIPNAQANDHADHMASGEIDRMLDQDSSPCPIADFHCMVFGGNCAPLAIGTPQTSSVKFAVGEASFFTEDTFLMGRNIPSDPRPPRA